MASLDSFQSVVAAQSSSQLAVCSLQLRTGNSLGHSCPKAHVSSPADLQLGQFVCKRENDCCATRAPQNHIGQSIDCTPLCTLLPLSLSLSLSLSRSSFCHLRPAETHKPTRRSILLLRLSETVCKNVCCLLWGPNWRPKLLGTSSFWTKRAGPKLALNLNRPISSVERWAKVGPKTRSHCLIIALLRRAN